MFTGEPTATAHGDERDRTREVKEEGKEYVKRDTETRGRFAAFNTHFVFISADKFRLTRARATYRAVRYGMSVTIQLITYDLASITSHLIDCGTYKTFG